MTGDMYLIRHRATKLSYEVELIVIPYFMFAAIWPALTFLCNLVTPVSLLYSCKKDSA